MADALRASARITPETWDMIQDRIERMKETHRGSNKQLRMLSGLTYCPHTAVAARRFKYQKANGVRYEYFRCSAFENARSKAGERPCQGDVYKLKIVEQAVVKAITAAIEHPEAIAAALAAYRQAKPFPAHRTRAKS